MICEAADHDTFAFGCVLHRCKSLEIHCYKLFQTFVTLQQTTDIRQRSSGRCIATVTLCRAKAWGKREQQGGLSALLEFNVVSCERERERESEREKERKNLRGKIDAIDIPEQEELKPVRPFVHRSSPRPLSSSSVSHPSSLSF